MAVSGPNGNEMTLWRGNTSTGEGREESQRRFRELQGRRNRLWSEFARELAKASKTIKFDCIKERKKKVRRAD